MTITLDMGYRESLTIVAGWTDRNGAHHATDIELRLKPDNYTEELRVWVNNNLAAIDDGERTLMVVMRSTDKVVADE